MEAYAERPPYQRSDYLGWIDRAKRPDTRAKRAARVRDEPAAFSQRYAPLRCRTYMTVTLCSRSSIR
jgi:hypothetical protein